MASLLTWTEYGFAAQQSTDNAVLRAGLDLGSSYIMTGSGDLAVRSGGTILGGKNNVGSNTVNSSVWSGNSNNSFDSRATFIGAGANNRASGNESVVGGGYNNDALNDSSVVAGGKDNTANNPNASVPGGIACVASANCTIASGNTANAYGDHAKSFGDRNKSGGSVTIAFGGSSANVTTNRSVSLGGYAANVNGGTSNNATVGGYAPTANLGVGGLVLGGYACGSINSYCATVGGYQAEAGRSGAASVVLAGQNCKTSEQCVTLGGASCNAYGGNTVMMGPANATMTGTPPTFELVHSGGAVRHISRVWRANTVSNTAGSIGFLNDGLLYADFCIVGIRADGSQGCSIRIQSCARKPASGNSVYCTGRSGFASPVVTVYTRDNAGFTANGSMSTHIVLINFAGPTAAGVTYRWAIHANIAYRTK